MPEVTCPSCDGKGGRWSSVKTGLRNWIRCRTCNGRKKVWVKDEEKD